MMHRPVNNEGLLY